MIYNQVYVHRLKRVICAYFYPKREKNRILYIYNKLLKSRRGIFDDIKKNVMEKLRHRHLIQQKRTCMQNIFLNHPTLRKICSFKCVHLKCFICNDYFQELAQCPELLCSVIFCKDCWEDIGRKCLVCMIRKDFEERNN